MVVQILSGIHCKKMFFSIKEKILPKLGDHVLVIAELDLNIRRTNKNKIARYWKKYSVNSINVEVSSHYMS